MENSTNNQVRKEVKKGNLTVSRVYKSDFQKEGTLTAELKQEVITKSYYPSKSVTNSLNDNIFAQTDFGFKDQEFQNKETRVAWIDVPVNSTVESVTERLLKVEGATLYKVLSNKPILSDNDKYAINEPSIDISIDNYANSQVVRYPEGHNQAGQLALDMNGKVQYRRVAFSTKNAQDIDQRTTEPSDFYASEEIEAELNGVHYGVTLESQEL